MCFLKELRPLANVSIFSVCHVHGHASLFLDRLGFQYKLNGDDRSVPNFCVYVICICVLCCVKSAIFDWLGRTTYITVGNDAIKYY